MPDIRRRLRSVDVPDRSSFTLKNAAGWASRGVFVLLLVAGVMLSLSADMIALTVIASVLVAQMLYVILPIRRIRARARMLWTGEAGEEAYENLEERGGRFR